MATIQTAAAAKATKNPMSPKTTKKSPKKKGKVTTHTPITDLNINAAIQDWLVNGPQSAYGDISSWDTSKVTNMSGVGGSMFYQAYDFNADISKWDTSKVTDMTAMFAYAFNFDGDVSKWDTRKVTDMTAMFALAYSFSGDVSKWDTSKVTSMRTMFYGAQYFNGDVSEWDTSKVTTMFSKLNSGLALDHKLSYMFGINYTLHIPCTIAMFSSAQSFNGDVSKWDTSKVMDMRGKSNRRLGPW